MTPLALHLTVRPILPLPVCLALAAAFAALLAWTLWRRPPARRRRLLLALRLAAAAAMMLLLFRPELVWLGSRPVHGQIAFLLDASRSMTIRDAAPSPTLSAAKGGEPLPRADALRHAFLAGADAYTTLAERFVVRPYAFGSHLRPIGTLAPEPTDPRTDPGEALADLADRSPESLLVVVLVGDGAANRASRSPPAEVAERLRARGATVHTVAVGSPDPSAGAPDLAVRDLRAPARVFAGNRAEVRARVAALGLEGRTCNLTLKISGQVAETRTLTFDAPSAVREVVFTPQLEETGLARLSLEAESVPGELIPDNNLAETIIRVEEGGVRVLYLDGSLRPEGKYLARALADARELDLARRIVSQGADAVPDADSFDVLVLGDLPAQALPAAAVQRLADRIRQGKLGLVALGGLSAFGAGGWDRTPIADLLPFAIRPGDGQVPGPLRFTPTAEGRHHFILSRDGAEAQGSESLGLLPALSGASAVGPLQSDATLLANSASTPLLATRDNGTFRSAALTADSTWLWVLSSADPEGPDRHALLWRQIVLWAARRDERPEADLAILTDRTRYAMPDRDRPAAVEVRVFAREAPAPPHVRVSAPDGSTRDLALEPVRDGEWRADLQAAAPGTWRLHAETAAPPLAADAEFLVELQDFEFASLLADHAALRAVAEAGGGTFRTLDRLEELLRDLAAGSAEVSEPAERRTPLASTHLYLALVLALLAADWLLRRPPLTPPPPHS